MTLYSCDLIDQEFDLDIAAHIQTELNETHAIDVVHQETQTNDHATLP